MKALVVEKLVLLKFIAFSWFLYPCKKAVSQQPIADNPNTNDILCIKGNSGNWILINIDPNKEINAAINTDNEVAFFQNKATKKITAIPGEK